MKYYKQNYEIFAFDEEDIESWVAQDMIQMDDDEIDRHLYPEKYLSDEEKSLISRQRLPKLSKRQFALYLYDNQLYDQIMSALDQNPRFKIEYDTVRDLERLSPTVIAMAALLDWSDDQVDTMWEQALTL